MKFDVVLGNPPYNDGKKGLGKLWPKFILEGFKLIKPNGFLLMVTPDSWIITPKSTSFKPVTNLFSSHQLILFSDEADKYFNVGESIGYFLLQNIPPTTKTKFIFTKSSIIKETVYTAHKISKSSNETLIHSIQNKVTSIPKDQTFAKCSLKNKDYKQIISKTEFLNRGIISETKNEIYSIPVMFSTSKTFFGKKEDINPKWRLMLNFSGYYYKKGKEDKYMPILKGVGNMGHIFSLAFDTRSEAENARSVFSSKLYQFYIKTENPGGFNPGITRLPILDFKKSWTDQEIYNHFNLTQEEIDLIENIIK
jgi:site-specific DNA-methyltransferase (adenine-specific)